MPGSPAYRLDRADALRWLAALPAGGADAVITDPPYSSGGRTAGERQRPVADKYVQRGSARFAGADFPFDALDQRSWTRWCAHWLADARRAVRPGGYALAFCDWRQLPAATDALQMAGWTFRGVLAWDKGPHARGPHKLFFRHQCEFVVWGTNGPFDREAAADPSGPWPGCYTHHVRQPDKHHPTGKPTALMRDLVRCVPPGGLVLDPFSGSGTTGVAALLAGRRFAGCELDPHWHAVALARLAAASEPAAHAA